MKVQKIKSKWNLGLLVMYEFVIISDWKTISQCLIYILFPFLRTHSTIFQINKWLKSKPWVVHHNEQIALSNPPENWTMIFWICWTNLPLPEIAYCPWPISKSGQLWVACLNRIRWINWIYCVFVQAIYRLWEAYSQNRNSRNLTYRLELDPTILWGWSNL